LVGRDAAFDPISIIEGLLKNLFGDDEEEPEEIALDFAKSIFEEVPFVGGLLGGGRVPLSSAFPYVNDSNPFQSMYEDVANRDFKSMGKELLKPLYYLAMPVGGGQIKKTIEGLSMFSDEHPIAGSYTDSGKLRYPVEDNIGSKIQAALFGQYSSKNAREYFDEGRTALGEKQIQEFMASDMTIQEYWKYREGLKGKGTLGEQIAYIVGLDIPIETKNLLVNNLADRKEKIDVSNFGEYDDWGEFEYAHKYPVKQDFLTDNGITAEEFESFGDEEKDAWNWAYKNPDKFVVAKTIAGDVVKYREYASKISEIEADKDKNGKSISGSRKTKVFKYINGLDIDAGTKMMLFKSEYPTDNTYNRAILEYLQGRSDIDMSDRVSILKELGFKVDSNGKVSW
jgi:hypothetical protein